MISEELLTILACPVCKGNIEPDTDRSALLCRNCNFVFQVRDGIPIMLIDQPEQAP